MTDEPSPITGFTLFENNKGDWQLSYRRRNETGWSVHIVDAATANRFLELISDADRRSQIDDPLPGLFNRPDMESLGPWRGSAEEGNRLAMLRAWLSTQEKRVDANTKAREGYRG